MYLRNIQGAVLHMRKVYSYIGSGHVCFRMPQGLGDYGDWYGLVKHPLGQTEPQCMTTMMPFLVLNPRVPERGSYGKVDCPRREFPIRWTTTQEHLV